MKGNPSPSPPARADLDPDLADQAAMCASMLRTLSARWRSRLEIGQLGSHSRAASLAFVNALERAAAVLDEEGLRPGGEPPAAALVESERRFRLLVESVKDYAIFMLDPTGRITTWNEGAGRMKGYTSDKILGKHFRIFYTQEAIAARHPEKELELAVRDGRYEEEGWRLRSDGSRFWASVVITAMRDASGDVVGFAKVTRDITERRMAEDALRSARDELERRVEERTHELTEVNEKLEAAYRESQRAIRMREEILAVVSHDLRNPLAAVHMAATVLLMKAGGDHQFRKHAETIHRSASRMEHLLSDLLDMASLQAGRLALEQEPVDAPRLLAEVFELHEPIAREKGLKLERAVRLDGMRIFCDRDRVLQVFGNLLGNAIKLCQPGDVITVRGDGVDGEVQFAVADTGPGIPAGDLPHLFEPFWSAERHAKKGTGLGLYISKGIVESHGGRLWVESEQGKGAAFFFTLPLAGAT